MQVIEIGRISTNEEHTKEKGEQLCFFFKKRQVIRKGGGGYYFGISRAKQFFEVQSFSEHKMVGKISEKRDRGIS